MEASQKTYTLIFPNPVFTGETDMKTIYWNWENSGEPTTQFDFEHKLCWILDFPV